QYPEPVYNEDPQIPTNSTQSSIRSHMVCPVSRTSGNPAASVSASIVKQIVDAHGGSNGARIRGSGWCQLHGKVAEESVLTATSRGSEYHCMCASILFSSDQAHRLIGIGSRYSVNLEQTPAPPICPGH